MKYQFFSLAKRLSTRSDHPSHQLGAVVAKKNRVISVGWNSLKTSPKSPTPYHSIHAEFSAVMGVGLNELKGATIYVYRQRKDGSSGTSRPCAHCMQMLKELKLDAVCYSEYNEKYTKEKL